MAAIPLPKMAHKFRVRFCEQADPNKDIPELQALTKQIVEFDPPLIQLGTTVLRTPSGILQFIVLDDILNAAAKGIYNFKDKFTIRLEVVESSGVMVSETVVYEGCTFENMRVYRPYAYAASPKTTGITVSINPETVLSTEFDQYEGLKNLLKQLSLRVHQPEDANKSPAMRRIVEVTFEKQTTEFNE